MIRNVKHRGLKKLFEQDDCSKIRPDLVDKTKRVLARLNASVTPQDMNVPGFGLHAMTGNRKGFWSVVISRNWRIISASKGVMPGMWILSIITKGVCHAHEKPAASRPARPA